MGVSTFSVKIRDKDEDNLIKIKLKIGWCGVLFLPVRARLFVGVV